MNLVEVKRISYYPPSKGYAVLLFDEVSNKNLPIIVGSSEAQAIALYLENVDMPRPMTHDLIFNIIEDFKSEVVKIIIARESNGTIFAEIHLLNSQIGSIIVDSRPSDSIAIALRSSAPIYVSDEVMDRVGITNDSDKNKEVVKPINSKSNKFETSEEIVLENLNEALEKAISEEEYEVAARLRDRIKQLEKKSTS